MYLPIFICNKDDFGNLVSMSSELVKLMNSSLNGEQVIIINLKYILKMIYLI